MEAKSNFIPYFSYGSNNLEQLKKRVKNDNIVAYKAYLNNIYLNFAFIIGCLEGSQDEKGNWTIQTLINRDDKLHLDSVNLTLTMADIYEDVIEQINIKN